MTLTIVSDPTLEEGVYQFAAAPANRKQGRRVYAARVSGLYYTEDEGQTWGSAYASLNLPAALATLSVVVPHDSQAKHDLFAGLNGGLLHSTDGGGHWATFNFADPQPAVATLVASPDYAEDGRLWAGTLEDGVWYSTDFGGNWQTGNIGLIDLSVLCLAVSPAFKDDGTLFAGTPSGLFASRNGGRAWREVPLPMGFEAVLSLVISPAYAEDGTLWAGTETQGLWRSADRGEQWARQGAKELTGAINQVVMDLVSGTGLAVAEGEVWLLRNGRWARCKAAALENKTVTSVLATQGLAAGASVLAGLDGGQTVRARL